MHISGEDRGESAANQAQQQIGYRNEGSSCFNAPSRVSWLLSLLLAPFSCGGVVATAAILGLIPANGRLLSVLLHEGIRLGLSFAQRIVEDPGGTVSRIGDALVWNCTFRDFLN